MRLFGWFRRPKPVVGKGDPLETLLERVYGHLDENDDEAAS